MKVLLATPRYHPHLGGVETHVRELAKRLTAAIDVCVLTTEPGLRAPVDDELDGVPVRRVPSYLVEQDLLVSPEAWKECRGSDADLVHFHNIATGFPVIGMTACLMSKRPYLMTFHSGGHSSAIRNHLRSVQWRSEGPLLRRASALIAVSGAERRRFSGLLRVPEAQIHLVRNGGDFAPLPAGQPRDSQEGPTILCVGRLVRYKGHQRAITCLPHLLRKLPGAVLYIVGEGPYKDDLACLADELGVAAAVRFTSFSQHQRQGLFNLITAADALVLLSDYEANPVAVMEALAVGTPVLGSAKSGFLELRDEGLIKVVHPESPPGVIVDMVAALVRGGRRKPYTRSWDTCAEDILAIYHAILAG